MVLSGAMSRGADLQSTIRAKDPCATAAGQGAGAFRQNDLALDPLRQVQPWRRD